jgi:hypothetical protein
MEPVLTGWLKIRKDLYEFNYEDSNMEFEITSELTQLLEKILTSLHNIERLVVKRENPIWAAKLVPEFR